jgi:transmembrane sensor
MTDLNNDWKRIVAHLSGNLDPHEQRQLNKWILASDRNKAIFEEATKIWKSSATKRLLVDNFSTEDEWTRLKQKIDQPEKRIVKWIASPYPWISLAAAILLFLFVGKNLFTEKKTLESIPIRTSISSTNKVVTFFLPDSSKVWLNINSQLSYVEEFASNRRLKLTGEAFFDVKHDSLYPFVIDLNSCELTVLGTSFNVQAKENSVNVAVVNGKVRLKHLDSQQETTLTAGERGEVDGNSVVELKKGNSFFDSWRKKNNPIYNDEVSNPLKYVTVSQDAEKNQINQTVVEGTITNAATLASFQNIYLNVSYIKQNGKRGTTHLTLEEVIKPGETITYRKKLLDIFSRKPELKVKIEKINAVN